MSTTSPMQPPSPAQSPLRQSLAIAARFWEPRRLIYNLFLGAVVGLWVIGTWPHFRPALTIVSLGAIAMLALLANVCYCAAYFVDVPMQQSVRSALWKRFRWMLWIVGMLFALVLENYWIADEIYPDVTNGTQSALGDEHHVDIAYRQ